MKKRILIISDLPVLPCNAGNKARVWALMNNLKELGHEVWFLGLGLKSAEADLLTKQWEFPVHNIPSIRARHAHPRWFAMRRLLSDRFISRGIGSPGVDYWYWPHWDKAIAAFAKAHTFDVVVVEYVFLSKALLHFPDSVTKVIDTHDVFTGRREKLKARSIKKFYQYLTSAKEEARGLNRSHVVIGIQHNESSYFRSIVEKSKKVFTIGHTVKVDPVYQTGSSNILFLGSDNRANIHGLNFFIEKIFPRIRDAVPSARLLLAGTICKAYTKTLPAVDAMGEIADLGGAYRKAAVVINPVLVGTGLKTKSIEAMAFGCPMVTTPCGAEGLEEFANSAYCLAKNETDFANSVIEILNNPDLAVRYAAAAKSFAETWNEQQLTTLASAI